jgi:hypothetical protein
MERADDAKLYGGNRCEEVSEHGSRAHLGIEDGGALACKGRRTRAAVAHRTATVTRRTTGCGTLAGDVGQHINRLGLMGWFRRTGECMGVWVVGPDRYVGGCGAQLAGLGGGSAHH